MTTNEVKYEERIRSCPGPTDMSK